MSSIDLSQNEFFLNVDDIQKVETRKKKKVKCIWEEVCREISLSTKLS